MLDRVRIDDDHFLVRSVPLIPDGWNALPPRAGRRVLKKLLPHMGDSRCVRALQLAGKTASRRKQDRGALLALVGLGKLSVLRRSVVLPGWRPEESLPEPPPEEPTTNRIEWFRVQSIRFHSDHAVLTDNAYDWTWKREDTFPVPHWTRDGQSSPTSHSMYQHVELAVEIEVGPEEAVAQQGFLTGVGLEHGFGSAKCDLSFASTVSCRPGMIVVKLRSRDRIPVGVRVCEASIDWKLELDDGRLLRDAATGPHRIYVTYGQPRIRLKSRFVVEGDGATIRRMEKSITWSSPINDAIPTPPDADQYAWTFDVIGELMAHFKGYRLGSRAEGAPPGHPGYRGDAWTLSDFEQFGGHCVAICRLVNAMARQLGLPAETDVDFALADYLGRPFGEGSGSGRDGIVPVSEREPYVSNKSEHVAYSLLDGLGSDGEGNLVVQVGDPTSKFSRGFNTYEACLRVSIPSETRYYGGGLGGKYYATLEKAVRASFSCVVWHTSDRIVRVIPL